MTEVQTSGIKAGWHPGADYALAWEVITKPLGTLSLLPVGSFGHGGAFGTHGWIIPKRNMITVFMVGCTADGCADAPEDIFQQMVAASLTQ
jgi:CubicO group peptidase (beta-lactamase class C family)